MSGVTLASRETPQPRNPAAPLCRIARLTQVPVSDLRHGDDHRRIGAYRLLELAAEARYVRIDGAAVEVEIDAVVPDAREQLVARNDAIFVAEEVHEQIKLFGREFQLVILRRGLARRWIELDERVFADRLRGQRGGVAA